MKSNPENMPQEEILARYLANECSGKEKRELEAWISHSNENRRTFEEYQKLWEQSAIINDFDSIDVAGDWEQVQSRLTESGREPMIKQLPQFIPWLTRIAALIILAIGVGIVIRYVLFDDPEMIHLLAEHNSEEVLLSDGTRVFLNKNSKLSYPEKFSGKERIVELMGEAYFEVTPNKAKAFHVLTSRSETRVLGTSFNIHEDAHQMTTTLHVTSGQVAFYNSDDTSRHVLLARNEKAILENNTISTTTIDNPNFLSWKTGMLEFNGSPLSDVIVDLSDYYKQIIVISDSSVNEYEYTSIIDNQSLEDVLEEIKLVFNLEHLMKNDTLFVYPNF